MRQAAQLQEFAEMPEGSLAPAAASAPWAFAILVVGTSLDSIFFLSRAPLPAHRRRSLSKTYKEN